ncbi:MAG: hypothetical protein KDJ38_16760 [Gammaproteobacteria bacterium]|nr:hypothetical protein [Gammaproteobacteria bacterium]
MDGLEVELKVVRALYERRLRTLKRVHHHLKTLNRTDREWAAGEVSKKIAEAELASAKEQLDALFVRIRELKRPDTTDSTVIPHTLPSSAERDRFSEALNRTDPSTRLQLAK